MDTEVYVDSEITVTSFIVRNAPKGDGICFQVDNDKPPCPPVAYMTFTREQALTVGLVLLANNGVSLRRLADVVTLIEDDEANADTLSLMRREVANLSIYDPHDES